MRLYAHYEEADNAKTYIFDIEDKLTVFGTLKHSFIDILKKVRYFY